MSSSDSFELNSEICRARLRHSSSAEIAVWRFSWYVDVVESGYELRSLRWAFAELKRLRML